MNHPFNPSNPSKSRPAKQHFIPAFLAQHAYESFIYELPVEEDIEELSRVAGLKIEEIEP